MKKVLVAGGAGYIGAVMCDKLLKDGYEVVCLDRFYFGKEPIEPLLGHPQFSIIRDDIRTVTSDVFKGVDIAIDLAGLSNDPSCDLDPNLTEDINHFGSVHFAKVAKSAGVARYVYASSCSVYGAGKNVSLTEDAPFNPISLYAKSKVACEIEIGEMSSDDFCVTFLRNATVYGLSPRMRFDLIVNIMTAKAVTQGKIYVLGGGKQWRPNIHVKDVVKAFMLVMEADKDKVNGEAFNLGANEQNYQVIQVANMIREVVPYVEVVVVPDDVDKRNYNVNCDKITNVLGFKVERTILEGAVEVKQAIEQAVTDIDDIRTTTLNYYKYLINADEILNEVKIDGKIF